MANFLEYLRGQLREDGRTFGLRKILKLSRFYHCMMLVVSRFASFSGILKNRTKDTMHWSRYFPTGQEKNEKLMIWRNDNHFKEKTLNRENHAESLAQVGNPNTQLT